MHNTGLNSCRSSLYSYPAGAVRQEVTLGYATTDYRLARVNLDAGETFFFEPNYPIVLVDRESIIVEVDQGAVGSGESTINYQILGDTDVV